MESSIRRRRRWAEISAKIPLRIWGVGVEETIDDHNNVSALLRLYPLSCIEPRDRTREVALEVRMRDPNPSSLTPQLESIKGSRRVLRLWDCLILGVRSSPRLGCGSGNMRHAVGREEEGRRRGMTLEYNHGGLG